MKHTVQPLYSNVQCTVKDPHLKIIATKIGRSCGLVEGVFREEKCRKRWHFLRPISKMPRRPKLVSNQQPEAHL
jgi:hypothetical protein